MPGDDAAGGSAYASVYFGLFSVSFSIKRDKGDTLGFIGAQKAQCEVKGEPFGRL